MKVEINNLKTIKNYAVKNNVTPSYIYKLEKEKKMSMVIIDGVKFVDTASYPTLKNK